MQAETVVAGGGIAGAATCLALAQQGMPATWILPDGGRCAGTAPHDGAGPLADKPGESLAAAATPLLRRLGLAHLLDDPAHRRVAATYSSWGSDALLERSAIAQPAGLGYVVHRGRLEAAMTDAAAACPEIRVVAGHVTGFRRRPGDWQVEIDAPGPGDAPLSIDTPVMADATGRAAAIGRRLAEHCRSDRLIAAYAFLDQVDLDVDPTPATLIEAVETGWWYATLLADGRLAVNHYTDPDLLPPGLGRDPAAWRDLVAGSACISRWIESAGFALSGPPALTGAGTSWLSRAAGPGWIAVGDAAAAFDPLSAHGMTTALWTGIAAAEAIRDRRDGGDAAFDDYADRVLQGVARYCADRQRIYAAEGRFADRPFWARRRERPIEDRSARRRDVGPNELCT